MIRGKRTDRQPFNLKTKKKRYETTKGTEIWHRARERNRVVKKERRSIRAGRSGVQGQPETDRGESKKNNVEASGNLPV